VAKKHGKNTTLIWVDHHREFKEKSKFKTSIVPLLQEAAELYAEAVKIESAKDGFDKGTLYGIDAAYDVERNKSPKPYDEALTEYLKTVKL